MTIKEYAKEVARVVNGEATEQQKPNGVIKTGITFQNENGISPCIYIDEMFKEGYTVGECAEQVLSIKESNGDVSFDPNMLTDYDTAKQFLTLRLYNKGCSFDVAESAERYGFDDLILVPVLDIDRVFPNGSVRVKADLIKHWEVSEEQVFADAMDNIKAGDYEIKSMNEVLAGISGEDMPEDPDAPEMYVVTNKKKAYGAYGVIKLADELKERFPDGYTVIPSSIHEVIVMPGEVDESELAAVIGDVNDEAVVKEEQLGNKPYFIAA